MSHVDTPLGTQMRYGASTLGASTSLIFPLAERKRLPHASRGSKHGHHGPRFPRVHRSLASSSISGPVLGRSPHPIELQQALACLDTIASGAHASNIAKRGAANEVMVPVKNKGGPAVDDQDVVPVSERLMGGW